METNSSFVSFIESNFHVADYIVFASFLSVSGIIGIYFSVRGHKNTQDYFLGGRQMRPIPVGISTGVSFMSSASLVGIPSEIYINGFNYIISLLFVSLGFSLGCYVVTSILHPLSMTSISEYLQARYHSKLITISTNVMVILCILQYMGICMLGTATALNNATGGQVSVIGALAIGGGVGVFYTTIGGIKAVVWTDVLQFGIMFIGIISVLISSIVSTPGGIPEIIRVASRYERLSTPIWAFDITIRHTFWGLTIGIFITWSFWSAQPATVQRLCSMASRKDACIVATIASSIFFLLALLPSLAGLNIYSFYAQRGCDVFAAGWVKNNEIITYYVRERLNFPGFQGLFIAALYAGSLSSISSGLNAASSILWRDTIAPSLKANISESRATLISKVFAFVFGVLGMCWCYFLYSSGGSIIQVSGTIDSSMYGAYFSVFLLSVLFGHANYVSAFIGMLVSFAFVLWIGMGSLLTGKSLGSPLETVTTNCMMNGSYPSPPNITVTINSSSKSSYYVLDTLYSISYEWLGSICILTSLVVALIAIGCTGVLQKTDERLLISCCRSKHWKSFARDPEKCGIDEEDDLGIPDALLESERL